MLALSVTHPESQAWWCTRYPGAGKEGLWDLMEIGKDECVGSLKLGNHKNVPSKIILQIHRNNECVGKSRFLQTGL